MKARDYFLPFCIVLFLFPQTVIPQEHLVSQPIVQELKSIRQAFCGPKSLLVICRLLNIPASFKELCVLTDADEKGGTTMLNLFQAAKKLKLKVSARKLNLKQLKSLDELVIAFLNADHFLVVEEICGNWVRVIEDVEQISRPKMMITEDFQKAWSGKCLVFHRPSHRKGTPRISFITPTIYDFGAIPRGTKVEYKFTFRNDGDAPLNIKNITSTCGCTVIGPSQKNIPPEKTGEVYMSLRIAPEMVSSRQLSSVLVTTNDPSRPLVILSMTGEAKSKIGVLPSQIYIGRVRQDSVVHRKVKLHFPEDYSSNTLSVQTTNDKIKAQTFPGARKDMIIVGLTIGPDLPVGNFSEELIIYPDSKKKVKVSVPIQGEVVGDLTIFPGRFFFGVVSKGEESSSVIELCFLGKEEFKVTDVKSNSKYLKFVVTPIEQGRRYSVKASLSGEAPVGMINEKVYIHTNLREHSLIEVHAYGIIK